jgi:hypothetical protein
VGPRRAPKRAVWRRHRVWPWALAAAALALGTAWQLMRTLGRRPAPQGMASQQSSGTLAQRVPPTLSLLTVDVVDVSGVPVSDCNVELHLPGQEGRVAAAAERCEAVALSPVPPGDYLLAADAPGFQRSERTVHLRLGASRVSLAVAEGASLSGEVVDADGRPVPGVWVALSPTQGVTHTGAAGTFHVSVPGPGVYSLEAHHSDWGDAVQHVDVPSAPVTLRLEPRAVLELTVHLGARPLGGAEAVLFESQDGGEGKEYAADRATDGDGGVQLKGIPPGSYTLEVSHPGAAAPVRQEVELREGVPTRATVLLPPIPKGALEGVVVDAAGRPVPATWVRTQPGDVPPVPSDAEGGFRLLGLREAVDYQVAAEANGRKSPPVTARAGDKGLRLVLLRARVYQGRVVDEAQRPVPEFWIGEVQVLADDGRFALPLEEHGGNVVFTLEAPRKAMATVVRPAGREDMGDIPLRDAPTVHGVVLAPDGGPAAEAFVICEGCRGEGGGERHLAAFADSEGRFALSMTGPYGVLVRMLAMKDGQVAWAEAGRAGEAARFTLAAPAHVQGRVLRPNGEGAPGVAVGFFDSLLETPPLLVTGADGSFSGDVPPGLYQVRLSPDASRPRRTWTVQVPTDLPLELLAGAAL